MRVSGHLFKFAVFPARRSVDLLGGGGGVVESIFFRPWARV